MKIDCVGKGVSLRFVAGAAGSRKRGRPTPEKAAFVKLIFATVILLLLATPSLAEAASSSIIPEGAIWNYLIRPGSGLRKWNHIGFDDSQWPRGPSGFGFGGGRFNTRVDALRDTGAKIFVRRTFVVNDPNRVTRIRLSIVSDGPFVAHINGIEVFRSMVKVSETIDITGFAHELFPGTNLIAIETFPPNGLNGNFSFIPSLEIVER